MFWELNTLPLWILSLVSERYFQKCFEGFFLLLFEETHPDTLEGLDERDCKTLEAWVPPTPGTKGEVLFLAIWCLLLETVRCDTQV